MLDQYLFTRNGRRMWSGVGKSFRVQWLKMVEDCWNLGRYMYMLIASELQGAVLRELIGMALRKPEGLS